jgi:hypothetical protein
MAGFEIVSEVTTESTDFDGARHSAWSEWSKTTAPDNYAIDDRAVKVEWLSDAGSENNYQMIFEDWVVLVPGTSFKAPRTIKVQTYARGPKGSLAGRGWSKVKFTGEYVKYQ